MAIASLHIICGNCGRNDFLSYHIDPLGIDISDASRTMYRPAVFICCENCGVAHNLMDTIKEKKTWNG